MRLRPVIRRLYDALRARVELGFVVPANYSMQNYGRMRFLHDQVARHARHRAGLALEIGCFEGGSTVVLAKACQRCGIGAVVAIDLFTGTPSWGQTYDTEATARRRIASYGLIDVVSLVRSNSRTYPWTRPIDVLHVDGDHAVEAVRDDIAKYMPFLTVGGIAIFDDYDASHPGVQRAVHELLSRSSEYQVIGVNYEGDEYGSICLQRSAAS